jgi:hypothetical protein
MLPTAPLGSDREVEQRVVTSRILRKTRIEHVVTTRFLETLMPALQGFLRMSICD